MPAAKPFTVAFIERPIDPAFLAHIREEERITLLPIPGTLPEADIAAALRRCHACSVDGTRGELPAPWQVTADFPGIMLVVSQAVGFGTVDPEPPHPGNRLLSLLIVVATPHLAGATRESRANGGRMGAEALIAACRGETLPRVVNPAATFRRRRDALPD